MERSPLSTTRVIPLIAHSLSGLIALAGALTLIYGSVPGLLVTLGLLGALGGVVRYPARLWAAARATPGAQAAHHLRGRRGRRSRTPSFHAFLLRELGDSRRPGRLLHTLVLRPLAAPTFAGFWQAWNPVYRYVTLFGVYRPLRRRVPRPLAVYLTFLASGFLLHDLPFNLSADLARGEVPIPRVTLLFALFGGLSLLSGARPLNLAGYPRWVRVGANLGWLAVGFGLHRLILGLLPG